MQTCFLDLRVPLTQRLRLATTAALVLAASHAASGQAPLRLSRDVPPVPVYATEWTPVGQSAVTAYSPPIVTSYAPPAVPEMPVAGMPTQYAPGFQGYPAAPVVVGQAPVTTYLPASPPAYFAAPAASPLYAPSATYAPMIAPPVTAPAPVVGYAPPTFYVPAPPPSNRARRRMMRGW